MITVVETTALAKEAGGHLASIDTKLPTQAAGALPVSLPSATITALTPPTTVAISNFPGTQPVSGSVSISGSAAITAVTLPLPTGAAQETGGHLASMDGKLPALSSGAVPVTLPSAQVTALTPPTSVGVNNFPATQTISGAVSVSNFPSTQAVTGTFWQATQPVSGTITANAGTNLNTSALALETGGNLAAIAAHTPALGAATTANSSPVNIASDQVVPIKSGLLELSGLSAGSLNADLMPSTDCSNYRWISLQILGTFSGTLSFQCSNDNVNFLSFGLLFSNTTNGVVSTTATTPTIWHGPIPTRYIRVRMTGYTSGTATGVVELSAVPAQLPTMGVTAGQTGTWSVTNNPAAATTGGATPSHTVALGTTTPTNLKASGGTVYGAAVSNAAAYPVYLKLFNKASTPATGTDVPIRTIMCPAGNSVQFTYPLGVAFTTGIGFAITKALADLDNTSLVAGDCVVDIDWK